MRIAKEHPYHRDATRPGSGIVNDLCGRRDEPERRSSPPGRIRDGSGASTATAGSSPVLSRPDHRDDRSRPGLPLGGEIMSRADFPNRFSWTILLISAIIYSEYHGFIAFDDDDVGRFETTMALSISVQVVRGPGHLYGPFDATNRLVNIHAPLYYRTAALPTWLLIRSGLTPSSAAFASGRLLSFVSLIVCGFPCFETVLSDRPCMSCGQADQPIGRGLNFRLGSPRA